METIRMIGVIALAGLSFNCSVTIETTVGENDILASKKSIAVICNHDDLELKKEIEEGLTRLGYSIADSSNVDLFFKISYDHYFDVFHNTSNLINITITEGKRVLLTSGFSGDTPYGSSGLVEKMLEDIRIKLRGTSK